MIQQFQGARHLGITNLATACRCPPSTVHAIVTSLESHGLVAKEHSSSRYLLAPRSSNYLICALTHWMPLPGRQRVLFSLHVYLDTLDAPGHAPCSGTVRFSMICAKPLGISPGNWGGRRVRHRSRVELL